MRSADVYAKFQAAVASVDLPDEWWHADVRLDNDTDGVRVRVYHYGNGDLTGPDRKVVTVVPWAKALRADAGNVRALVLTMLKRAQRDGGS